MPSLTVAGRIVQFVPAAGDQVRWWVVRALAGGGWTTRVLFGDRRSLTSSADPQRVIVNAIEQAGNVSAGTGWRAK